jgi:hypothetical protein
MIDVREDFLSLSPVDAGLFLRPKKRTQIVILTLSGTAQPISMQLNDLSLKPRDTFEQSRFIPSRRPCTLKFFATLPSGQKTSIPLFSTLLRALWTRAKSGV